MIRLTLTLAAWVGLVPVALASLTPRQQSSASDRAVFPTLAAKSRREILTPIPVQEQRDDYTLTERTEVLLDGRPCRFEDVPARATIIGMEVGPDRKTVLKVRFRSRK